MLPPIPLGTNNSDANRSLHQVEVDDNLELNTSTQMRQHRSYGAVCGEIVRLTVGHDS